MSLLVGSILFMGAVTGEANHQPKTVEGESPVFTYEYDFSFIVLTIAFCLDEIAGVLSVYLFIIHHKDSVKRKHNHMKAQKTKSDRIHSYFRRTQSRNHSYSSTIGGGETSRKQSTNDESQARCGMGRDISRMTALTTLESPTDARSATANDPLLEIHNNPFSDTGKGETNHIITNSPPRDRFNKSRNGLSNGHQIYVDLNTLTVLPPDEFQNPPQTCKFTGEKTTNYYTPTKMSCKTTTV